MPLKAGNVELTGLRSKGAKHYRNPDGTLVAQFTTGAYHYQATPGAAWSDLSLAFRAGGGPNNWVADQNNVRAEAYQSGSGVNATYWFRLTEILSGNGVEFQLANPATATAGGSTLGYTDSNNLTWTYTLTPTGAKLGGPAVPASLGAQQTYTFTYRLVGAATALAVQADGSLGNGSVTLGRAGAKGADGRFYSASAWRVVSGTTVAFDWDDRTANNGTALPAAAYPYVVDPSTTFTVGAAGDDGKTLKSGTSYANALAAAATWSGTSSSPNASRSQITSTSYEVTCNVQRWDTSSLGAGAGVTGVTYYFDCDATTAAADGLSLLGDWHTAALSAADHTDLIATPNALAATAITFVAGTNNYALALLNPTNVNTSGYTGLRFGVTQRAADAAPTGQNGVSMIAVEGIAGGTRQAGRISVDYVSDVVAPAAPTGLAATVVSG